MRSAAYYGECVPAMRILRNPNQAIQLIRLMVRMLAKQNPITAEMAMNTAVQTAWVETALRPIDRLSIAAPVTKVQSTAC